MDGRARGGQIGGWSDRRDPLFVVVGGRVGMCDVYGSCAMYERVGSEIYSASEMDEKAMHIDLLECELKQGRAH